MHVKDIGNRLVENIREQGVDDYAKRAVDIGQQVAAEVVQGIIELLLMLVISIYLLLDAPRIARGIDRVFPPGPDGIRLGPQVQKGLIRYVRGQATVSLLIGTSCGIGVEILSLTGVWPDGDSYALILGLWAMATEVIPYVGPILGALPALALAAIDSPYTALWVGLFYLGIHQLEGHVIVPRVMGQALGAHPLLVIFALVAGAELYGIVGALLSLPLLAMGREVAIFLHRRIQLEPWPADRLRGRRARRHGARAHRARTTRARVSASAPLIACAGLVKSFGGRQVLGPIDLALQRGRSPRAARPQRRRQDDAALAAGRVGRGRAPAACSGRSCARSASCRSARRSTAASARARTSSCSRGSRACPSPRPSSPS